MQQRPQHMRRTLGMYKGTCLVHAPCTASILKRSQLAHRNIGTCYKLMTLDACGWSTRHVPRRLPCPCLCTTNFNKMKYINRKFISILTCNKGHERRGVTRHVPRRVHRPCLCISGFNKIRYITENLSAFTHATKATTHAAFTRHVPRRVPRSCPCTAYVYNIKYRTENSSAFTHATKAMTHVAYTKHVLRWVPSSMTMHNRL